MHQLLLLGDQEDHCCWNPWSYKYRTEVGKDDACEEYEPD